MEAHVRENGRYQEITTVTSKTPNSKPRVRNTKKNAKVSELAPVKKSPKASNKGKGKKRPSLLNKSIYRYHFQRTKPKLRRLLEANELLKDELERKNGEMRVLCGDIHNLLERLEPYVCGSMVSNNPDQKPTTNSAKKRNLPKTPPKSKPVTKVTKRKAIPEKPAKRPRKTINDKQNSTLLFDSDRDEKLKIFEVSEFICNGDSVEKVKVTKKENSPMCPDIAHFISHQNQQILDDFMMLESPFFNLKRNDAFDAINDHDTCNGSLNIIPLLKEPLDDSTSLDRRCSLELSSEASSADSLSTQTNTTFLKQMKSHLSFFIPSEMDHQLVSQLDKLPPTLPDDIFSET